MAPVPLCRCTYRLTDGTRAVISDYVIWRDQRCPPTRRKPETLIFGARSKPCSLYERQTSPEQ